MFDSFIARSYIDGESRVTFTAEIIDDDFVRRARLASAKIGLLDYTQLEVYIKRSGLENSGQAIMALFCTS
jgi:hypothetical protein